VRVREGRKWRIIALLISVTATAAALSPIDNLRVANADAAGNAIALSCSASSSLGSTPNNQQLDLGVVGAPTQSLPGKTFTISIGDGSETLPASLQGYPVTSASDLIVKYPVPANSEFVSVALNGGSNVGTGATVAEVADASVPGQFDVVETIPGPISSGQSFSLPSINLTVLASNSVGATITSSLLDIQPTESSSSSNDPAVTATMQVAVPDMGLMSVSQACWPTATDAVALSKTAIVSVDTTPPDITVTSPQNGGVYTVGQVVDAEYGCTDVASYGIATCLGSAPAGSAIDTSTPGNKQFVVNATDLRGTPAQLTVSYYVKAAPATNVIGPVDAGTLSLTSGSSCSFGGSGCPVSTGPEVTYKVAAPAPNGGTLVTGDRFFVQWQIYEPGSYSATGSGGPQLTWTLPAPSGAVIDGQVTTSAIGLLSQAIGQGSLADAGACSDPSCTTHSSARGILEVNGQSENGTQWTYNAVNQQSLITTWDENSAPQLGTDGLYLDVSYTVKVTTPGTVTLPGFIPLLSPTGLSTTLIDAPSPSVSFTVVDPTPPSISIGSPVDGGIYDFGQVVDANYSCADPIVPVIACNGTVADGAPIDTTSAAPGDIHTFSVTARDSQGNTASTQVEYFVRVEPPATNPQSYAVPWASSAKLPVLATDTMTDFLIDPGSVVIVTPPSDGTATANSDGTVTFTDNALLTYANYVHTGNLNDSFSYQVSDTAGHLSNVTTISLTVLPQLTETSISPTPPQGLVLQQPQSQPIDSLDASSGTSCTSSALALNGQALMSCGKLAPVTIINDGATNGGWSLTGQVSDFVDATADPATSCDSPASYNDLCIPGGDLGWTPNAQVVSSLPGSGSVVRPGGAINGTIGSIQSGLLPAGNPSPAWVRWPMVSAPGASLSPAPGLHESPQVLCQSPANVSEGWFVCGADLSLPVPASSAASSGTGYEATLTLTLTLS
jgi:dehydratase